MAPAAVAMAGAAVCSVSLSASSCSAAGVVRHRYGKLEACAGRRSSPGPVSCPCPYLWRRSRRRQAAAAARASSSSTTAASAAGTAVTTDTKERGHGDGVVAHEAHVHGNVRDIRLYKDAASAFERIKEVYDASTKRILDEVAGIKAGHIQAGLKGPPSDLANNSCYPYVGLTVGKDASTMPRPLAYGNLSGAGTYGATVTRPDLFEEYYMEQLELLLQNYDVPLAVGVSNQTIPLPFVQELKVSELNPEQWPAVQSHFTMPDLARIDDAIPNSTHARKVGAPRPLALYSAERVDLSLARLGHYTATSPEHFQRFVLFTNYQRYVDQFVEFAHEQVRNGTDGYSAIVTPGDVITTSDGVTHGTPPKSLPQMPAYHLVRAGHTGITLINIGVGPSNTKTITDHVAVLRPHCWLMVGHCGGLRASQTLGDYVLAHAYVRRDHVLDEDVPLWVPVPPLAEVQVALQQAVSKVTGASGSELKKILRTGTVVTTDDRNWEFRRTEMAAAFNQSRAIAIDMESATVAANGFRMRVPYGTLLCVSDKPLHGQLKLKGMANQFYNERVGQHLAVGIEFIHALRDSVNSLHSRKLRAFDEPAFR